jgi:PrcB C-terminal
VIATVLAVALVAVTTAFHEDTKTGSGLRDTPSGVEQSAAAPRTIEKGDQSNVDDARQVVVRTDAEWTKLWQQHSPDRKRPAVDFSKEMVVGVFMGSRSTSGYSVSIGSAASMDGHLVVRYQESTPPRGAMTAQVLSFPYHLVAVPKATGDVKFEKVP